MNSEIPRTDCDSKLCSLLNQLTVTRKELQNIRKEIRRLNHCYQKDVDSILTSLKNWKCQSCSSLAPESITTPENVKCENENNSLCLQPIGQISSSFHEKRGTPRQPGVCIDSRGEITLFNTVFTNPSHALEGLEQFSHMWIIFHFHKNDSTHVRAKVAPPRLNGLRTGVFGTRSPHRPSPIGLSLVRIDKIEGSSVYFSGVDMLDGTPVLDIKPYIPQYDNPFNLRRDYSSDDVLASNLCDNANESNNCIDTPREAPDGEECCSSDSSSNITAPVDGVMEQIRVPQWISEPINSRLTVTYKEKVKLYLDSLKHYESGVETVNGCIKNIENVITRVLEEDPRSVYVRERYSNQFYTFLIENHHVSCKFDDTNHSVQVYKITKANPLSEWKGSFDDSD